MKEKSDFLKTNIILKNAKKGDDFVGIEIKKDSCAATFPMGYKLPNESADETRNSIHSLISTLTDFGSKHEGELESSLIEKDTKSDFPIRPCIFIIEDFLQNGYYSEKRKKFVTDTKGKINWPRTIKQTRADISKSNDIIYLNFIVQKSFIKEDELITQIHKYCVWKAFSLLGFMYTNYIPSKPSIPFNKTLFIQILQNHIKNSFSLKNNYLFFNMIAFLEKWNNSNNVSITIGTKSFEHVWEYMIDCVYGTYSKHKKDDFYPFAEWHLYNEKKNIHLAGDSSSELRPDTIMIFKGDIFIIDSKYYRFNINNTYTLPPTESIAKQIIYGEYIDSNKQYLGFSENTKIFNVFILPYSLNTNNFIPKYFGFADATWKNTADKTYYKIISVLLDSKYLMENYTQPDINAQKLLSECIIKSISLR